MGRTAIPLVLQLRANLRFLPGGSNHQCSRHDFNVGLQQPMISVVVRVLNIIEQRICAHWIKTRMTEEEQNASNF